MHAVTALHVTAPFDMAVVWQRLLFSAASVHLCKEGHGGEDLLNERVVAEGAGMASGMLKGCCNGELMKRVDRSLTLLLAILTQGKRGSALVPWQQALHFGLLVAGNDIAASKEQRVLCALITCSVSTLTPLAGHASLKNLVSPKILARWLLSYPFDAIRVNGGMPPVLTAASDAAVDTGGDRDDRDLACDQSRGLQRGMWIALLSQVLNQGPRQLSEECGIEKCVRLFGWLPGKQLAEVEFHKEGNQTKWGGIRHVASIDVDTLCAALIEDTTTIEAHGGCNHGMRIEICNLEALCLLSLPEAAAEPEGSCDGQCLGEMLSRALQGNEKLQQLPVQLSRWTHDTTTDVNSANSHTASVQQHLEARTLGEFVDQLASQAWVQMLVRTSKKRTSLPGQSAPSLTLRCSDESVRLAFKKMLHASVYPESFGLLLQHEDPAVRVLAMEAAAMMPANMKLYIQLARQLLKRAAHAISEEENDVVIGIIRHAKVSACYYSTVATGFWYEWLRQVLTSVAAALVGLAFSCSFSNGRERQDLGISGKKGTWAQRLRLLRVMQALLHALSAADIDDALIHPASAADEGESTFTSVSDPGAIGQSPGGRASSENLVSALASMALEAANPTDEFAHGRWQPAEGVRDDSTAVCVLAIGCLHCMAAFASPDEGRGWQGRRSTCGSKDKGVGWQAEKVLLQGVLSGAALGRADCLWHAVQSSLLNLAAARPQLARRQFSEAVATAVRDTSPSAMSAYARLSSLLLRIQALS